MLTAYIYKVRRQTNWLDDSTALKRATTYVSYDEPLCIGNLYIMQIGETRGFYRIEELFEERVYD